MVPEIGKTVQRGFAGSRFCRLRLKRHGETSVLVEASGRGQVLVATFRANRSASNGRNPATASRRRYRLRQIPPMSRRLTILANFDGERFVTQFLPITPQPPIRLMLVS